MKEGMCKYLFLFISVSKLNFFNIAVSIVKCNLFFENEVDIKIMLWGEKDSKGVRAFNTLLVFLLPVTS